MKAVVSVVAEVVEELLVYFFQQSKGKRLGQGQAGWTTFSKI